MGILKNTHPFTQHTSNPQYPYTLIHPKPKMSDVIDTTNVKKPRARLEDLSLKPARTIVYCTTKDPLCNEAMRNYISNGIGSAVGNVSDETFWNSVEAMRKEVRAHVTNHAADFRKLGDEGQMVEKIASFINYGKKNVPHVSVSIQCEEKCQKTLAKSERLKAKRDESYKNSEAKVAKKELEDSQRYGGNQPFKPKEENWEGKEYDAVRKPGIVEVVPKGIPNLSALYKNYDPNIAKDGYKARMISLQKNPNIQKPIAINASNYEEVKLEAILDILASGQGYCPERDSEKLPTAAYERAMNQTAVAEPIKQPAKELVPVVKPNSFAISFLANSMKEKAKRDAEKAAMIAEKKLKRDIEVAERKAAKKAKKAAEKAANIPEKLVISNAEKATVRSPVNPAPVINSSVSSVRQESDGQPTNADVKTPLSGTGLGPQPPQRRYVAYEHFITGILNDKT